MVEMKNVVFISVVFVLAAISCQRKIDVRSDEHSYYYSNPLYCADFPDPDVVRVGDDFYMVTSSFPYSPGLPVYHSTDLVHWRIITNVFQRHHSDFFDVPRHGMGVWAPSIRYHDAMYYVFYGDPDFGIVMSKAPHPEGPWSDSKLIAEGKGWIDPCPFWDDDGQAYLVRAWARSRSGINAILTLHRMSAEGDSLLDSGQVIFDGTLTQPIIEGPKMHKRNGYYYIFAPAGSVPMGWQTVLRSKNIYGPYEERIVMAQGTSPVNGPHQGGMVKLESGEYWFLHFQDHGTYGRILHLNPIEWTDDDWPLIGLDITGNGVGEPVMRYPYPNTGKQPEFVAQRVSDDFEDATLSPQWRWQANFREEWYSLTENHGHLRLFAHPVSDSTLNILNTPHVLTQRFPAEEFVVTMKLDISGMYDGDICGMTVTGNNYGDLRISREGERLKIEFLTRYQAERGGIEQVLSTADIDAGVVFLKLAVSKGALCTFSFSENGDSYIIMGRDFKAQKLLWVGSSIGVYCVTAAMQSSGGHIDIDWFDVDYQEGNPL
jgi:beta-xylosidase